jgi:uncharacterized protein YbjQ (UPF0145 family)
VSRTIQEIEGVKLFTVSDLSPHYEIEEFIGVVIGNAIFGGNIFRDIFASVRDVVGGRTRSYEKVLQDAMLEALVGMAESAARAGANAVIDVQLDTESMAGSKTNGMLVASATGMAVRIRRR